MCIPHLTLFVSSTLTGLAVFAAGVAWNFGRIGPVTAVMAISLPVLSFQTPARVVLERAGVWKESTGSEMAITAVTGPMRPKFHATPAAKTAKPVNVDDTKSVRWGIHIGIYAQCR